MPQTEKHHYVSRCYLKNFSFDKKGVLVYAYQRKKPIITTNIKNIAAKKNLYTFLDKTTGKKKVMSIDDLNLFNKQDLIA